MSIHYPGGNSSTSPTEHTFIIATLHNEMGSKYEMISDNTSLVEPEEKPSAPEKVQVDNADIIIKIPSRHEMMETECVEPNPNNPLTTSPKTLVEKAVEKARETLDSKPGYK